MATVQLSRSDEAWVRDLAGTGTAQRAALTELRTLLVRAALFTLGRDQGAWPGRRASQVEALAEACAKDALQAILESLPHYRFECRFTTWAYKFAVNGALNAARHERWKNVSLATLLGEGAPAEALNGNHPARPPDQAVQPPQFWAHLQAAMDRELSPRQRQVINALVFEEVPLDEIARHLGSNRNAVYDLVHAARRKLKAYLGVRGYRIADLLEVSVEPR